MGAFRIKGVAPGRNYSFLLNLSEGFRTECEIGNWLAKGQFYEPDVSALFSTVLRPGDHVVDLGANVGWFTMLGAALVGSVGSVVALDPDPENIRRLTLNAELNAFSNVTAITAAASDEPGEIEFHLCAEGSGGNAMWDPGKFPQNDKSRAGHDVIKARAVRLDSVITTAPRLIKIDIEGAEALALRGASGMLTDHRRPHFIVAELHEFGLEQMGSSQADLRGFMYRHGYDTWCLFSDGGLPQLVPHTTELRSQFILNLLFADRDKVASCWPRFEFGTLRSISGYAFQQ